MNTTVPALAVHTSFDADYFSIIINSRALSASTLHKSDFIPNLHKLLKEVIISGITSRLKTSDVKSLLYKIKNNQDKLLLQLLSTQ